MSGLPIKIHSLKTSLHSVLPELKAQGKTILVISHDDKYFHLGDRVLKLDYGQLVEQIPYTLSSNVASGVG